MKKITILMLSMFMLQLSHSQVLVKRDTIYPDKEEPKEVAKTEPVNQRPKVETLFQDQKSFGGYLGINMGYTQIDGEDAFIAGGRAMFVANHYIGIGFGGKGFMTMPKEDSITITDRSGNDHYTGLTSTYISNAGGYGGLYIEPVLYSLKPVHVAFPIMIGAGGIVSEIWSDDWSGTKSTSSAFFIIEPGVDVEFNIAQWFRIGLGASYRITSRVEGLSQRPADLMEGFNYGLTFKFGWF